MKLISLNTWGGQLRDELRVFIERERESTDIFCFQEVFNNAVNARRDVLGDIDIDLYKTLIELLPNHVGQYAASQDNDEGLAIFAKPSIGGRRFSSKFVHRYRNAMVNNDGITIGRNIQVLQFVNENGEYTIINFHGLWSGGDKKDTPSRIEQSKNIRKYMDELSSRKNILIGDFNLEPNTNSMAILEKNMRNLIREYGITSTRSYQYTKSVKYADYAIVSKEIQIDDFKILQDSVSDHLPLQLDFN